MNRIPRSKEITGASSGGWPDISTATYDNKWYDVSGLDPMPLSIFIGDSGTKAYVIAPMNDAILQFLLSTPYDIESAAFDVGVVLGVGSGLVDAFFSPDGTYMFIVDNTAGTIYQYQLSTPWNIHSIGLGLDGDFYFSYQDPISDLSYSGTCGTVQSGFIDSSGVNLFLGDTTAIYHFSMSIPWELASGSLIISKAVPYELDSINFQSDGLKMISASEDNNSLNQFLLSTPWDIETLSYDESYSVASQESNLYGSYIASPEIAKFWIIGTATGKIYQYSL